MTVEHHRCTHTTYLYSFYAREPSSPVARLRRTCAQNVYDTRSSGPSSWKNTVTPLRSHAAMSAALSVNSSGDTLRRTLSGSARTCSRSRVQLPAYGAAETSAVNGGSMVSSS